MKIYLVRVLENYEYGDYGVYGCFSTKEKAEKCIIDNELNNKIYVWWRDDGGIDEAYIEEWRLN